MKAYEVNFDGIVGPTHNYAGLSYGNVASQRHRRTVSNPREAALQGLAKMKLLADLGVRQAVLPPQERPDLRALRAVGFEGDEATVLANAARQEPALLAACYSASSMWAANAATVAPSADTSDGRVHFTPANLASHFHRSLEAETTAAILRAIFPDPKAFAHHAPLGGGPSFGDEGAANHTRLCANYGDPGIEMFVYGRRALGTGASAPAKYPARQTFEASSAVARLHRLDPDRTFLLQQNPDAIDAGVFHNDVIAVGNRNVLLYHELAFIGGDAALEPVRESFARTSGEQPIFLQVRADEVALADAIGSYLFNSQLVSLPDDSMALVVPAECMEYASTKALLERLTSSGGPIRAMHIADLRQSMQNGGGPACLRLRVVLSESELQLAHPHVFWSADLHEKLTAWVMRHYRDRISPEDLADPQLAEESRRALDALTGILDLGTVYPFQRTSGMEVR